MEGYPVRKVTVCSHAAGVGMDEVAAAPGTSTRVVHRHFTDRAGLYTPVAERVDATIVEEDPDDLTALVADGLDAVASVPARG